MSKDDGVTREHRPLLIKGADGKIIEIEGGQYYINTKARVRYVMKIDLSNEASRVYACLELATMGWQQELAVIKTDRGKPRPLAPSDIMKQTGLRKQSISRAFRELEDAGLAKRESDDGNGLRNGHMRLYSWAQPHPTAGTKKVNTRDTFPAWFPDSWAPLKKLITRLRLKVTINEVAARDYLIEGEEAARAYQNGQEVAARFLERVCAQSKWPAHNKEERTERKEEKEKAGGRATSGAVGEPEPESPPARPPARPSPLPDIKSWLHENIRVPTALDEAVVQEIQREIPDEAVFKRFQTAALAVRNPRKWKVFVAVARQARERGALPDPPPSEETREAKAHREMDRINKVIAQAHEAEQQEKKRRKAGGGM